jgi:hypothetical protein
LKKLEIPKIPRILALAHGRIFGILGIFREVEERGRG